MGSSFVLNLFVGFILVGAFRSTKCQLCYASESETSDSKVVKNAHLKYGDGSWKPLHEVVIFGSEADVQELLNNGANVNLVNGEKWSALHVAVFYGFENIVNLLIKNGANIDLVNIFGKTSLHMAAERGNERIVTLLVRNGANIDIVDADGFTASDYAIKKDNWIYDVKMESLLNYGVNSNRNVLIFWSSDFQNTPNFCLDKSLEFPPRNNQTCYLARLIRYFDSFDDASEYCRKFRPNNPPEYNPHRRFIQPIPSLNPTGSPSSSTETNGSEDEENDQETTNERENSQNEFTTEENDAEVDIDIEIDIANSSNNEIQTENLVDDGNNSSDVPQQTENSAIVGANTSQFGQSIPSPNFAGTPSSSAETNNIENDANDREISNDHENLQNNTTTEGNRSEVANANANSSNDEVQSENVIADRIIVPEEQIENSITVEAIMPQLQTENFTVTDDIFQPNDNTNSSVAQNNEIEIAVANNDSSVDEPQLRNESDLNGGTSDSSNSNNEIANGTDSKFSLPEVNIDADDLAMMSILFNGNTNLGDSTGTNEEDSDIASIQLEENEKAECRDGKIIVTKVIDNELEMTYTYGERLNVKPPLYEVKMKDPISENLPFKENAKKDRAYTVKIGGQFKEVKMAAYLVDGLLQMNREENRKDATLDIQFIAALIVGFHSRIAVKEEIPIHKDVLIFIKELFKIRIAGYDDPHGKRYLSFDALVESALKKIQGKK